MNIDIERFLIGNCLTPQAKATIRPGENDRGERKTDFRCLRQIEMK